MPLRNKRQTQYMRYFSTLAGPMQKIGSPKKYRVKFRSVASYDKSIYRLWSYLLVYSTTLLVLGFVVILFQPSHWIVNQQPQAATHIGNWIMLICLALLQLFLITSTFSSTRATLKARNPLPVNPAIGLRVAFATTRAPGEPLIMVTETLKAMKKAKYRRGKVDVWLLDETDDPELKAICKTLGVKHFSRKGIKRWNIQQLPKRTTRRLLRYYLYGLTFGIYKKPQPYKKPNLILAARTKHGNFNAWIDHLESIGTEYDILTGVDTDHVPQPNYLQRILGYFRDPNVAYVVGPQVYGNYRPGLKGLVVRWAESQASFFQSTIQRAGNATKSPMFVGTNYAVRMNALKQIGGFQPCITEDMATGLAIHTARNPHTNKHWESVYTPDVLAVGVGPEYWGPYFSQQWRWSAGSFDTWRRMVWRVFHRLSFGAKIHYFLMLTFYPICALTWLLGIISSMTYLLTGATAILAPWNQFVSLYMMTIVMQMSLYFWNRRFNVSPHEPQGSYGLSGIILTMLTSPVYLSALIGITLGKKANFVVTSKDTSANPDGLRTFYSHIVWAIILGAGVVYGIMHQHSHPAMLIWVGMQFFICVLPVILGMSVVLSERIKSRRRRYQQNLTSLGEAQNA